VLNQKFIIARNRLTLSSKYRDAKEAMQWEIKALWGTTAPHTGSVTLNIMFYFGDKRKRDIDAYIKICLDAMSTIVYEDDSLIDEMHVFKEVDVDNPRVVIQVL
jgi:Holliday junction resolvase RusA-like endonuclease